MISFDTIVKKIWILTLRNTTDNNKLYIFEVKAVFRVEYAADYENMLLYYEILPVRFPHFCCYLPVDKPVHQVGK